MKGKNIAKKITSLTIKNIEPNVELEEISNEKSEEIEGGGDFNVGCDPNVGCNRGNEGCKFNKE